MGEVKRDESVKTEKIAPPSKARGLVFDGDWSKIVEELLKLKARESAFVELAKARAQVASMTDFIRYTNERCPGKLRCHVEDAGLRCFPAFGAFGPAATQAKG